MNPSKATTKVDSKIQVRVLWSNKDSNNLNKLDTFINKRAKIL